MNLTVFLAAIVILAIVVLGLGVGIFFGKKKRFPQTSISKNKEMAKRGISCAKHEELHNCGISGGCCGGADHAE